MSDQDTARAEAEKRWPKMGDDSQDGLIAGGFIQGAQWADEQRAAQPTEARRTGGAPCEHGECAWQDECTLVERPVPTPEDRHALIAVLDDHDPEGGVTDPADMEDLWGQQADALIAAGWHR